MRILGINALYHDPSAALVVDGTTVAAAEEERFSRRKHGKRPVPFSAWEQPELAAAWCLDHAGIRPDELDAVTYSFDPALRLPPAELGLYDPWDDLRQTYAERAPDFLATALPGLDRSRVQFVPHHIAHAASAGLAAPFAGDCAVLVLDGRGERHSHLAGRFSRRHAGDPVQPAAAALAGTAVRGRHRSTSASSAAPMSTRSWRWPRTDKPRHLDYLRQFVHATGDGGFRSAGVDWTALAPPRSADEPWTAEHADLAVQPADGPRGGAARPHRVALRADRRQEPGAGRRCRAQLRRQHPDLHRVGLRPGLGAAGGRRRRHRARRCPLRRSADGRGHHVLPGRRPGPGVERRRSRGGPAHGQDPLRPTGRHRRRGGRGAGRTTASSPGSRVAASSVRGPWAIARCSPIPAGRATCDGSTT